MKDEAWSISSATAQELGYLKVPEQNFDRDRSAEELSAGEDGTDHDGKSGRVYGRAVQNGSGYSPQDYHYAE